MIKVLSIGNSFSQDATRYLTEIANHTGTELMSENLYIGGCSLETHYNNILSDSAAYELQINAKTINMSGIKTALLKEKWDFITVQQVSNLSVDYSTYQPYLNELIKYIKKHCPTAQIVVHQTWAYEDDSQRLCEELGYKKSSQMFADVKSSYEKAALDVHAQGIIPSGELFMKLVNSGISKVHRDTFHASLGLGRYALGLLWYKFFTKQDIDNINFDKFDEPITEEEIKIIKKCVNEIL